MQNALKYNWLELSCVSLAEFWPPFPVSCSCQTDCSQPSWSVAGLITVICGRLTRHQALFGFFNVSINKDDNAQSWMSVYHMRGKSKDFICNSSFGPYNLRKSSSIQIPDWKSEKWVTFHLAELRFECQILIPNLRESVINSTNILKCNCLRATKSVVNTQIWQPGMGRARTQLHHSVGHGHLGRL